MAKGMLGTAGLLLVYFTVITGVSGWKFAGEQLRQYWYFVVALAAGFGVQVGLYSYLKMAAGNRVSPRVVAATGATSTTAMISCCAHYLTNLLPILGGVGMITLIAQYQIQLFWLGLAFNMAGIVYLANKVYNFKQR